MIYTDQLDREISLTGVPLRIVSLVPSQTELLVALGLSDYIVGITKFCVHPVGLLQEKKIVGGTKNVHYDRISELKPDIILCNKEENTKEIVETLQHLYPVHVSDINVVEDALEMIWQYGEIFKTENLAAALISKIKTELLSFQNFIKKKPQRRVVYFIWRKPWMVAGNKTFINHLLEINGFVNVFKSTDRYPEISENELVELSGLDLVLLSSEPYPFSEKHISEFSEIIPHAKVILVDGEYFSWYGSRLVKAFEYFKTLHNSD